MMFVLEVITLAKRKSIAGVDVKSVNVMDTGHSIGDTY